MAWHIWHGLLAGGLSYPWIRAKEGKGAEGREGGSEEKKKKKKKGSTGLELNL